MSKKGPSGELEVAKILQPWWRQLEPAAQFVRTPGSGGWRHARIFGSRGDLMADKETCKLFPFSLEVKRREGWTYDWFLGFKPSPVWKWWKQTQQAATDDGRRPMLWFRKNTTERSAKGHLLPPMWLVMFDEEIFNRLRLRHMAPPLVRFLAPRHTVVLTHAQLLWIPPQAFVRACR